MCTSFHWGLIGLGKIAHKFARDLALLPEARLYAVASRSQEKADRFAAEYGAAEAYGNYGELLSCPELDAVYIATPHSLHLENSLMCLESGLPVLCEKPLALNGGQVEKVIHKAREKEVFLMEALWTRFHPSTRKVLELIEQAAIGEVLSVRADFGFRADFDPRSRLFDPALGGGALLDIGIYPVFLAYLLLGPDPEISARAVYGATGVDEECGITFRYPGGQMAHLHCSFRAHTRTEAFIYGTEGTIQLLPRWHEPTDIQIRWNQGREENLSFEKKGHGWHPYSIQIAAHKNG